MEMLHLLLVLPIPFNSTRTEVSRKEIIENRTIPADFVQKAIKEDLYTNSYGKVPYISKLSKSIGSSYTYAIDIGMTVYQDHFFNWEQELYPISHDTIYITCSL